MYQPQAKWEESGDSEFLMWGHIRVGEVTLGGNGTWYAYYRADDGPRFKTLRDFPALDLAKAATEDALEKASRLNS